MNNQSIPVRQEVERILRKFTNGELDITDNSLIMRDLELDSVKVMELIMEIEDHFNISVPLNSLPDLQTVNDLVMAITELKSK